jgi:hypothetical protein
MPAARLGPLGHGKFLKGARLSPVIRKLPGGALIIATVYPMVEQRGESARRSNRLSWIPFLGGICLLGVAILVSMLGIVSELVSTAAAIVGVAGMIYGIAVRVLVATSREPREYAIISIHRDPTLAADKAHQPSSARTHVSNSLGAASRGKMAGSRKRRRSY